MPRFLRCRFSTERFDGTGPVVANRSWLPVVRLACAWWFCLCAVAASGAVGGLPEAGGTNFLSLAELRSAVSQQARAIQSFRIEGMVCAVVRGKNLLAL